MENKPSYRIRVEIYDDEIGEVVAKQDDYLASDTRVVLERLNSMGARVLNQFSVEKEEHESVHYPKESEYEEQE